MLVDVRPTTGVDVIVLTSRCVLLGLGAARPSLRVEAATRTAIVTGGNTGMITSRTIQSDPLRHVLGHICCASCARFVLFLPGAATLGASP